MANLNEFTLSNKKNQTKGQRLTSTEHDTWIACIGAGGDGSDDDRTVLQLVVIAFIRKLHTLPDGLWAQTEPLEPNLPKAST